MSLRALIAIVPITFLLVAEAPPAAAQSSSTQSPTQPAPARTARAAALQAAQLAIVINDDDPHSVAVGAYYQRRRGIPARNVVHVHIPDKPHSLSAPRFHQLKAEIDAGLPAGIEAVLMIWTAPYAVDCNSITAAYTLGFDAAQCKVSCAAGQPSGYFNAAGGRPFSELGMRLSMLLPTESVERAKALIDRGVASGFRMPEASAYYLITSEKARNTRAQFFPPAGRIKGSKLNTRVVRSDALENARDVMIYQTGMAEVGKLDTLAFLPGALADHLTSLGGDLLGEGQMSSLRWLDAGATASYGSVSEPCNYWQKFPNPSVLLRHYLQGETAIEAYWKSVAWPAQGVFIGEPLAAPYRR
ncbi:MAG: TIGR03790 family protein [Massilia sp.]